MTDSSSSESLAPVRHMDALAVGTRLAEFEILSLLGVGGFGMVYKAFDHSLQRAVAIKEYMPSALAARTGDGTLWARSSADQPAFQAGLQSFVEEARMLAQFDHPSLVKVFRFWEAHNTAYMVMPLYRGMTFKQARAQMRAPPPEDWLRQVLWAVLDALRVLHDADTLHRDISPDNIFLQDAGPPVLLDLGASRHAINDRDRKHTAVLKVNYAPIEQYSDTQGEGAEEFAQGPWSDLYSLAAVVYGCLCNDAPLPATLRSLRDRMVPFSRVVRTVRHQFGQPYSAPFVHAISQSLKLPPAARPQTIDAFLALMEMGAPPAGMDHFDFRAGLGDLWVEPTDLPDAVAAGPTVDLTGHPPGALGAARGAAVSALAPSLPLAPQAVLTAVAPAGPLQETAPTDVADTVFLERDSVFRDQDTVFLEHDIVQPLPVKAPVGAAASSKPALESQWPRGKPAAPVHRAPWRWIGAGALAVAAVGVAWALLGQPASQQVQAPAADTIITELKPQAPALQEGAAPEGGAESTGEPATASAAAQEAPAIETPAPAFVAADDPRAVSKSAVRLGRLPKVGKELPDPQPIAVQAAEPEPAPAPPTPPQPAPRKALPPLCENTNVLTRSMCLRDACSKPGNAGRAPCIEFRKAMEPLERNNLAN